MARRDLSREELFALVVQAHGSTHHLTPQVDHHRAPSKRGSTVSKQATTSVHRLSVSSFYHQPAIFSLQNWGLIMKLTRSELYNRV